MLASISRNSFKQYDTYFRKWYHFCIQNSLSMYEAPIPKVIEFLTTIFHSGGQYGSLNSCKSALALILGFTISEDDRIQRFFKGVFRLRPPAPKYDVTWDTNQVLDSLSSWYPNDEISLEQLCKKCCTLLALVTAHRVQTLSMINIKNIEILPTQIIIKIPELIKTSRIASKQPVLRIPFFEQKPEICPAKTLASYLNRTAAIRKSQRLFISFKKPHNPVTTQTLSRWIKAALKEGGIDVSIFSAHSTRHASTSRALRQGVSIDQIRQTAGWSNNSTTFARFYNRNIVSTDGGELARAVLNR